MSSNTHCAADRITFRVVAGPDGCWQWTGNISPEGYGRLGGHDYAHRVSYEQFVGLIPEGLEIDHLCRNRRCCNPAHLEAVTHGENMRRAVAAKGHVEVCFRGHPYDDENAYFMQRGTYVARYCKACNRINGQAYRDRKRVAA